MSYRGLPPVDPWTGARRSVCIGTVDYRSLGRLLLHPFFAGSAPMFLPARGLSVESE